MEVIDVVSYFVAFLGRHFDACAVRKQSVCFVALKNMSWFKLARSIEAPKFSSLFGFKIGLFERKTITRAGGVYAEAWSSAGTKGDAG
ncbi:MAG: hypothetical protein AAGD04_07170 [Pseudomonadota bacterium]